MIICFGVLFASLLIDGQSRPINNFPLDLVGAIVTLVSFAIGTSYLYLRYPITASHFGFGSQDIKNTIILGSSASIIIILNFSYKTFLGRQYL
jgi:hypothetical protein